MNKPMSVKYVELREAIANLINDSGFPAFIVEPMMRDFVRELADSSQRQYQYDIQQYAAMMAQLESERNQKEQIDEETVVATESME